MIALDIIGVRVVSLLARQHVIRLGLGGGLPRDGMEGRDGGKGWVDGQLLVSVHRGFGRWVAMEREGGKGMEWMMR